MCGIAGILLQKPSNHITSQLIKMTDSISHRGPDDSGLWTDDLIGLGHRRLSILDLSSHGAQPMKSSCGRYILIYNGEIYNHLNLRIELEKKGLAPLWRGQSDTETLLAFISCHGLERTLNKAHGMFSLALWDRKESCLKLARDRMGEKPLYWGLAGSDFIFGSEIKALRQHPQCPTDICQEALIQYLRYMYVPAPRSIYRGIYKLEPGTILKIRGNFPCDPPSDPIRPNNNYKGISIYRYWDLNNEMAHGLGNKIYNEKNAISKTESVLKKAINKQMISDVSLGAFLSGGVDSSLIVSLMQDESNTPIQTFTIGFEESTYDESPHAAKVAAHLGTMHSKLLVTDNDAINVIPNLPQIYDEPFADSSQIPTYLLCYAARQNVTVALSGDGGDELFGGYNRYIKGPSLWNSISYAPKKYRGIIGSSIHFFPEHLLNKLGSIYNLLKAQEAGISNLGLKAHKFAEQLKLANNLNELHRNMASAWLEPENILATSLREPKSIFDDHIDEIISQNSSSNMMFQDMRTYLPDDILCKVDRAAMSVSLETRTPFLDPDVVLLSTRIPNEMKIRDGYGKWILRQILYKHVPKKIIERPKVGFAIPLGLWLRGPLRDWAESLLSNKKLLEDGLFNASVIRGIWHEHLSGHKDWSAKIWTILMFQSWKSSQDKNIK